MTENRNTNSGRVLMKVICSNPLKKMNESGLDDSDDDAPRLSEHALLALQEFYAEQSSLELSLSQKSDCNASEQQDCSMPPENWQMSQFWYDTETADVLASEVLAVIQKNGRVACISCPTLYHRLRAMKPADCTAVCLEFDTRFSMFGEDFVLYDYNMPLNLPPELENTFDIVVADPPFLSEECLRKVTITVQFLTKKKIILCTGALMSELARELLQVKECQFRPRHANNLANEFRCFTNYDTLVIDKTGHPALVKLDDEI